MTQPPCPCCGRSGFFHIDHLELGQTYTECDECHHYFNFQKVGLVDLYVTRS